MIKNYKAQISELKEQGLDEETAKNKRQLFKKLKNALDWEQNKPEVRELWENEFLVYAGFNETYKRLGVDFDQVQYESNTYLLGKDIIEEGLAKGVFFKKKKIILFGLI